MSNDRGTAWRIWHVTVRKDAPIYAFALITSWPTPGSKLCIADGTRLRECLTTLGVNSVMVHERHLEKVIADPGRRHSVDGYRRVFKTLDEIAAMIEALAPADRLLLAAEIEDRHEASERIDECRNSGIAILSWDSDCFL